jgi:hypothetical protein
LIGIEYFSIKKEPLKPNLLQILNVFSSSSGKHEENLKLKVSVFEKKNQLQYQYPKLDFGFSSRYRNLVLVKSQPSTNLSTSHNTAQYNACAAITIAVIG